MLYSLVLSGSTAWGGTWTVGPQGDFATVQEAVDAARPGDVIDVAAGRHPLHANISKELTLRGQGVDQTRLVASDVTGSSALTIDSVLPVTVSDLTLDGAGTHRPVAATYATVVLAHVAFENGPDVAHGGHLHVEGGHLTLRDVDFTTSPSVLTGGHLYAEGAVVTLEETRFSGGEASVTGGSLQLVDSTAEVRRSHFEGGRADNGGALGAQDSDVVVEDCTFVRNEADDVSGYGGYGGAMSVRGGSLRLLGGRLADNVSEVGGGALELTLTWSSRIQQTVFERNSSSSDGGAVFAVGNLDLQVWRNRFVSNRATSTGGTLLLGAEGTFDVAGNHLCDSDARDGGAVAINDWSGSLTGTLRNNIFHDVVATQSGASVLGWGTSVTTVSQNTFVASQGPQALFFAEEAGGTLSNNVVVSHVGGPVLWAFSEGAVWASWNLYWDASELFGGAAFESEAMVEDPQFVDDGPCGSFRTNPEGPTVDGGDPTVLDDDGTIADLGAYGGPGASLLHDLDEDGVIEGDCDPFDGTRSAAADCEEAAGPPETSEDPGSAGQSTAAAPRSWFCGPTGPPAGFVGLLVLFGARRQRFGLRHGEASVC
ncbi:MAG: hypothetical protein KTR31_19845 [Myxococcales bacterium]|nr:hypothetical protein [Myxococcales bacterium]